MELNSTELKQKLDDLCKKHNANFSWTKGSHTWCLHGTDNGNGWETDDYSAENKTQAMYDAIDYLIAYNEE